MANERASLLEADTWSHDEMLHVLELACGLLSVTTDEIGQNMSGPDILRLRAIHLLLGATIRRGLAQLTVGERERISSQLG